MFIGFSSFVNLTYFWHPVLFAFLWFCFFFFLGTCIIVFVSACRQSGHHCVHKLLLFCCFCTMQSSLSQVMCTHALYIDLDNFHRHRLKTFACMLLILWVLNHLKKKNLFALGSSWDLVDAYFFVCFVWNLIMLISSFFISFDAFAVFLLIKLFVVSIYMCFVHHVVFRAYTFESWLITWLSYCVRK